MQPIVPELEAPKTRVADNQPQYEPVTVALVTHFGYWMRPKADYNTVVMAFRPSNEEREAIARGADIYVGLLTFAYPQQPILVLTGKEEAAKVYGVAAYPDELTESVPKMSPEAQNATKCNGPAVEGGPEELTR